MAFDFSALTGITRTPPYGLPADLDSYGPASGRLDDLLPDFDDVADKDAVKTRARRSADAMIDAKLGACYDAPLKVALTGTITTVGTAVTGAGTVFLSELAAGQMITANDESVEVTTVTSDGVATLKTAFTPDIAVARPVVVTPRSVDDVLRWASAVLTVDNLKLGATDSAGGVKAAAKAVMDWLKAVCEGTVDLPGLTRTGDTVGFAFEPFDAPDFDPVLDLQKAESSLGL